MTEAIDVDIVVNGLLEYLRVISRREKCILAHECLHLPNSTACGRCNNFCEGGHGYQHAIWEVIAPAPEFYQMCAVLQHLRRRFH